MKTRKVELDVDFIGGQEPLTTAEEQALSEYFKKRKLTAVKRLSKTVSRESKISKVKALFCMLATTFSFIENLCCQRG